MKKIILVLAIISFSTSAFAKRYWDSGTCQPYAEEVVKQIEELEFEDLNERAYEVSKNSSMSSSPTERTEKWEVRAEHEDAMNLIFYDLEIDAFQPIDADHIYCDLISLDVTKE